MTELEGALHEVCRALGGIRMLYMIGYTFPHMEEYKNVVFLHKVVFIGNGWANSKTYTYAEALLYLRALSWELGLGYKR